MLKIGLGSPQYGLFTDPATISGFAATVETIGYDSLWVGDRALVPTQPRDPYPGGGPVPEEYRTFLDPVATLSFLAHATRRLRLGTSTLNAPFYSPLLLARSLTTVDILSGGRLDIGFGLGWSSDEYEGIGVPWRGRGARLEEILDVLEHVWSGAETEHRGSCGPSRARTSGRSPYSAPARRSSWAVSPRPPWNESAGARTAGREWRCRCPNWRTSSARYGRSRRPTDVTPTPCAPWSG